jgi:hypothetical protein
MIAANQHAPVSEVLAAPYALEMPLAGMLGCAGGAILSQALIAYFPRMLKVSASQRVRPAAVIG